MKKVRLLCALLLLCQSALFAQSQQVPSGTKSAFTIYIRGTALSPPLVSTSTDGTKQVSFSTAAINTILSQYTITQFEPYCSACRLPYLHNIWYVEAYNATALMNALLAYSSTQFTDGQPRPEPKATYTPNDYALEAPSGHQFDLDLIQAKRAWNITHGNPDVIVGITDTHFELDHPDLAGKIVNNWGNICTDVAHCNHGTAVAGCVAAATDNNKGLSAIGFNTRLDISSTRSDNEMAAMAAPGVSRKILNGSWFNSCTYPGIATQMIYDDIYENGTIAFFGAGNGGSDYCNYLETYPAALNHNMAVSSVGSDTSAGATENIADVHEKNPGSIISTHNHYPAVDIVAPGYNVQLIYPLGAGIGGYQQFDGTSFASPITAGTAALLLAINPYLSPYQMEYVLKRTADTTLFSDSRNAPYIGKLGAGRLDAYEAVKYVNDNTTATTNLCNDPLLQTMVIKGVEINTLCAPGFASNGALPKLKVILSEGQAPFTYQWTPLPGNTVTLNNYTIDTPTIISATTGVAPTAHFYLIVKDASGVAQKVASKEIQVKLKTSGYDLAMRDSYVDMLDEPNGMAALDPRDEVWWDSPDIWNRRQRDYGLEHQNPEYYTTDSNYLLIKIRNVGCANAPAGKKVHLYWTLQATGENWDAAWTTANITNPATQAVLPAGREITVYPTDPIELSVLGPGESTIKRVPWRPKNPADYNPNITELAACILARIEEDNGYPYGMTYPEQMGLLRPNALNNNNIVSRNMTMVDLAPGNVVPTHLLIIDNPGLVDANVTLQFINSGRIHRQLAGNFSAIGRIRINLGADLYERWTGAGGNGTYLSTDPDNYTVDFDGFHTLELKNIPLAAGERQPITVSFILNDNIDVPDASFDFYFRQFPENKDGSIEAAPQGGVTYHVQTGQKTDAMKGKVKVELKNEESPYVFYPNPTSKSIFIVRKGANEVVNLQIVDIAGRSLITKNNITLGYETTELNISTLKAGTYFLSITDHSGKINRYKISKL